MRNGVWGWVNEYIYIDRMELANNALPIYREGIEFKNMLMYEIKPTTECMQAYSRLSDCVLSKQLNVMDKEGRLSDIQPFGNNAMWSSGEPPAPEPSAGTTSKSSTARV